MGRGVCWYSWSEQLASLDRLRAFAFRHVLPGHGRRFSAPSLEAMARALSRAQSALAPRR
jgi:glyoxylase-like metal-dependent hydrolase (beta-lactamase superfamily II)